MIMVRSKAANGRRCSAIYLFFSCQNAQIRCDARKLNYFEEQIEFYQNLKKRKEVKIFRYFLAEHALFLPGSLKRVKRSQNLQRFPRRIHQKFLGSLERRKTDQNISEIFVHNTSAFTRSEVK